MNEEPSYYEKLATCSQCNERYWASESDAVDYEEFCSEKCEDDFDVMQDWQKQILEKTKGQKQPEIFKR